MSNIVKVEDIKLNSRKNRQKAIKDQIDMIDNELKELGLDVNLKFLVSGTISNPETPQNTVNIQSINDISFIVRLISYYENQLKCKKDIEKDFIFPSNFVFVNANGHPIYNIIQDLKLRLNYLINGNRITFLQNAKAKLLPFVDEENRLKATLKEIQQSIKN